jgi:hypothetical protein
MTKLFQKLVGGPQKQERTPEDEIDGLAAELEDVRRQLATLTDRLTSLESEPREIPTTVSLRSGMNLSKRTQALRQHRLGRASSEIAKDLEMPKAQIDLLVKVHRIISRQQLGS